MKSLYEMDREYELREAERKGMEKGFQEGLNKGIRKGIKQAIKEAHLKLINGLIGLGDSKQQEVIDFLTTYLHTTVAEANQQYQETTKQK